MRRESGQPGGCECTKGANPPPSTGQWRRSPDGINAHGCSLDVRMSLLEWVGGRGRCVGGCWSSFKLRVDSSEIFWFHFRFFPHRNYTTLFPMDGKFPTLLPVVNETSRGSRFRVPLPVAILPPSDVPCTDYVLGMVWAPDDSFRLLAPSNRGVHGGEKTHLFLFAEFKLSVVRFLLPFEFGPLTMYCLDSIFRSKMIPKPDAILEDGVVIPREDQCLPFEGIGARGIYMSP